MVVVEAVGVMVVAADASATAAIAATASGLLADVATVSASVVVTLELVLLATTGVVTTLSKRSRAASLSSGGRVVVMRDVVRMTVEWRGEARRGDAPFAPHERDIVRVMAGG